MPPLLLTANVADTTDNKSTLLVVTTLFVTLEQYLVVTKLQTEILYGPVLVQMVARMLDVGFRIDEMVVGQHGHLGQHGQHVLEEIRQELVLVPVQIRHHNMVVRHVRELQLIHKLRHVDRLKMVSVTTQTSVFQTDVPQVAHSQSGKIQARGSGNVQDQTVVQMLLVDSVNRLQL